MTLEIDYDAIRNKAALYILYASYDSLIECLDSKIPHFTLTDSTYKQVDDHYEQLLVANLPNKSDDEARNIFAAHKQTLENEKKIIAYQSELIFEEQLIAALNDTTKHFLSQEEVNLLKTRLLPVQNPQPVNQPKQSIKSAFDKLINAEDALRKAQANKANTQLNYEIHQNTRNFGFKQIFNDILNLFVIIEFFAFLASLFCLILIATPLTGYLCALAFTVFFVNMLISSPYLTHTQSTEKEQLTNLENQMQSDDIECINAETLVKTLRQEVCELATDLEKNHSSPHQGSSQGFFDKKAQQQPQQEQTNSLTV